jgi:hypothetical protein
MNIDLIGVLIPIVIGNIVTGVIFMVGFVQVVRRSIDKDIPARLASIDGHIEKLGNELLQMRRMVDKHEFKIESLEKSDSRRTEQESQSRRGDDLDESGIRRRRATTRGNL